MRLSSRVAWRSYPIWMCGFPHGWNIPVVRRGSIAAVVTPNVATIVTRPQFMSDKAEFPAYWLDVPIFPGNSGGPVLSSTGELLGMAVIALRQAGSDFIDVGVAVSLDLAITSGRLDEHLPADWHV